MLIKSRGVTRKQRPAVDRLPLGATSDDAWSRVVIPNFINLVVSGDNPWMSNEADIAPLLQKVWDCTYGSKIPFMIQKGTVPFDLISDAIIMIPILTIACTGLSEALPIPEWVCNEGSYCCL